MNILTSVYAIEWEGETVTSYILFIARQDYLTLLKLPHIYSDNTYIILVTVIVRKPYVRFVNRLNWQYTSPLVLIANFRLIILTYRGHLVTSSGALYLLICLGILVCMKSEKANLNQLSVYITMSNQSYLFHSKSSARVTCCSAIRFTMSRECTYMIMRASNIWYWWGETRCFETRPELCW